MIQSKRYDSLTQPVTFAVVHGITPKLRELIIPESTDYKTMFIAHDLGDEAHKIRWRSAFEKDPIYAATDKKEADRLMKERRNLLISACLDYLI